jgi:SAM-dependent methyltransferase
LICPVCQAEEWRQRFHRLGWNFAECRRCGLVRLDPLPTVEQLAQHYATRASDGNYEPAKARERTDGLLQVLAFAEAAGATGGRVFDVGCFDGGFLDLAEERSWEGWGLELQEEAARKALSKHPGRVFNSTVEAFEPAEPGSFDLLTAIGLVEHLRDPGRLFEIARESLRPGGLLVIQTPNRRSVPARLLGRYWPPIAPPEHTFYFDERTLTRICARHEMTPVRVRAHVKRLRIGYAYEQFKHFGPEFHRALGPLVRRMPQRVLDLRLPLYGGEMLFAARR